MQRAVKNYASTLDFSALQNALKTHLLGNVCSKEWTIMTFMWKYKNVLPAKICLACVFTPFTHLGWMHLLIMIYVTHSWVDLKESFSEVERLFLTLETEAEIIISPQVPLSSCERAFNQSHQQIKVLLTERCQRSRMDLSFSGCWQCKLLYKEVAREF